MQKSDQFPVVYFRVTKGSDVHGSASKAKHGCVLADDSGRPEAASGANFLTLPELRLKYARYVLDYCQGERLKAARTLGIGKTTLYRYLKKESESG